MRPLYTIIHTEPTKCISNKALEALETLGDWYITGTYLRIYGGTQPLHIFSLFFIVKLVSQEVAYQTYINRIGAML